MFKNINVMDPGIMEAGGHHFALVETLLASAGAGSLSFFTHKNLDGRILKKIESAGHDVDLAFSQNFYTFFGDDNCCGSNQILDYVHKLRNEYVAIFERVEGDLAAAIFFYPCVDWYHLFALRLAIESGRGTVATHKICLMFDFGINEHAGINYDRVANWLPHLRWALESSCVEVSAADARIIKSWRSLFPGIPLQPMPSYLAKWSSVPKRDLSRSKLLVYTGDVKHDKGFNSLPSVIERLLVEQPNVEIIVQFTWNWAMPEFEDTRTRLRELAEMNPLLSVFERPWDHQEFAKNLAECSAYYCTYNRDIYDHKSSGLPMWLGFYKIDLLGERPLAVLEELRYQQANPSYREAIYSDLIDFLQK